MTQQSRLPRRHEGTNKKPLGFRVFVFSWLFPFAAIAASFAAASASDTNDWPSHDHDAGGQRFSPLTQITAANAGTLQPA